MEANRFRWFSCIDTRSRDQRAARLGKYAGTPKLGAAHTSWCTTAKNAVRVQLSWPGRYVGGATRAKSFVTNVMSQYSRNERNATP